MCSIDELLVYVHLRHSTILRTVVSSAFVYTNVETIVFCRHIPWYGAQARPRELSHHAVVHDGAGSHGSAAHHGVVGRGLDEDLRGYLGGQDYFWIRIPSSLTNIQRIDVWFVRIYYLCIQ